MPSTNVNGLQKYTEKKISLDTCKICFDIILLYMDMNLHGTNSTSGQNSKVKGAE